MNLFNDKTISLNDALCPGNNCFTFLRLILASFVIFSHSFYLGGFGIDPLLSFRTGFGQLGVEGFFVISGFLVSHSFLQSRSFGHFIWKRFLRIFPAFWICIALTGLLISPLVYYGEHRSFGSYSILNNPFLPYVINNFFLFIKTHTIPGIFGNNPFKGVLNGSLWTLSVEFLCYLFLGVSMLLLRRFKIYKNLILYLFIVIILINSWEGMVGGKFKSPAMFDPTMALFLSRRFFSYFLAGILLFLYRKQIPVNNRLFLGSMILFLAGIFLKIHQSIGPVLFSYALIALAIKLPLNSFDRYGDYSYGLYIYAFPIQQTIVFSLHKAGNPAVFFLYSLIFTFPLAWLSWHFVEKPCLRFKNIFLAQKPL